MSLPRPLTGTLTALITPFDAAGRVDLDAFADLCERVVRGGSGLVPCGTTGETPNLTQAECADVIRTAVRVAAGRVPVVAGTGTSSTRTTIEQTVAAREAGADAALVVVPPYNKPPQRSLIAHFRAVADEGGLPVVLYNVPSRTGANLLPQTALTLAEDPRFVAIKEAAGSTAQVQTLLDGAPDHFTVLSGDDSMTLPFMALGAHGVVSVASNVVPDLVVRLVDHARDGAFDAARRLQSALVPLFDALFATANPIPVKRLAADLFGFRPDVRLPLTADAVDDALAARLLAAYRDAVAVDHALDAA